MTTWLRQDKEGFVLTLHIQPGAKQTTIVGLHGDALKIRLAAPPVDGKANAALIDYLAERLGIPRAAVEIVGGQQARSKRVRICGAFNAEQLLRLLHASPA
jgi:hypothetical protein